MHKLLSTALGIYHGLKSYQIIERFIIVYSISIDTIIQKTLKSVSEFSEENPGSPEEKQELDAACRAMVEIFRKSILVIMNSARPPGASGKIRHNSWESLQEYAKRLKENK